MKGFWGFLQYASFALTGALIFGFFGFVFGLILCAAIRRAVASVDEVHTPNPLWLEQLFQLVGYVCKVDGRVTQDEVAAVSEYLDTLTYDTELKTRAKINFNRGKTDAFDYHTAVKAFAAAVGQDTALAQVSFRVLVMSSVADGVLHAVELNVLLDIARTLQLSSFHVEDTLRDFGIEVSEAQQEHANASSKEHRRQKWSYDDLHRNSPEDSVEYAYDVLGVHATATDSAIKKRYRKLIKQYHPDTLIAKGYPADLIKEANTMSAKLNAAWDRIKLERAIA